MSAPMTPAKHTDIADISPAVKAAILRGLAGAAHPKLEAPNLAHRYDTTIVVVQEIAAMHGGYDYPDRMLKAAKILEDKPAGTTPAAPQVAEQPNPAGDGQVDSLQLLLAFARQSKRAGTRRKVERIEKLLDELRSTVRAEREAEQQKQAKARERAEAKAEVDRLRAQLAEAQAKLRGEDTATTVASEGPSSRELRAWAADNDVDCPAVGRVPTRVREAYDAAHAEAVAS